MPVSYTKSGGQGHVYQVPDYPEAADGPKAFKDFADFLDLILPPVGTIMPYVGDTSPTGWLLCEGQEVSSSIYPKLAAICGTRFGSASAGNFRLPNLRGRSIVGVDSSISDYDTVGKTGGARTVTLQTANLPAHTHSMPEHGHGATATTSAGSSQTTSSAGSHGHNHSLTVATDGSHQHDTRVNISNNYTRTASGSGANYVGSNTNNLTASSGSHSHSITGSISSGGDHTHTVTVDIGTISVTVDNGGSGQTDSTGSATAFSVVTPFLALKHIIRAA